MTVKFIDAASANAATSSVSAVYHNPVHPPDLLLAVVYQNLTGVASITGFTASAAKAIGSSSARATFLKLAAGSGQSATITATGTGSPTSMHEHVAEFSGVTATEDATMVTAATVGTVATLATGNITTVTAGCLLVAWLATQGNVTNAAASGWTVLPNFAPRAVLAWRMAPTTGAYGATWTWTTGTSAGAGIAAFRPASTPPADLLTA